MAESDFSRERREVVEGLHRGHFRMTEGDMTTSDVMQGKPYDTTQETVALYARAIAILERCAEP
jgi:hypothetical protein